LDHLLVKSTPLISTFCIFQELMKFTVPEVTQQNSPIPFCTSGNVVTAGLAQGMVGISVTVRPKDLLRVTVVPAPLIVTLAAPRVAVYDAVRVSMLESPVAGLGLNVAVTPAGSPAALSVTDSANPPVRAIAIAVVPVVPRVSDKVAGVAVSEKSDTVGGVTVRLSVAVRVPGVPVPVIVIRAVPSVAVPAAVSVSVVDAPVVVAGTILAVTPVGSPLTPRSTAPAKPLVRRIETVAVALPP